MKNVCIFFLMAIIISLTAFGMLAPTSEVSQSNYLRMHIRAHSNQPADQAIKYEIRDEIVTALTPIVAECDSKEQAVARIQTYMGHLAQVAVDVLQSKGISYGAKAELRLETFPTRVYEGYTLPQGEYLALIVQLGEGKGDNWWCVVYPPLCFTASSTPIVYKSKILEIIKNFKKG